MDRRDQCVRPCRLSHVPLCASERSADADGVESARSDEVEEGGDAEQIAALQAKVAALERQLKGTSFGGGGGGGGGGSGSGSNSSQTGGHKAHMSPSSTSQRAASDSFVNARGSGAAPFSTSVSTYPMDSAAASIPGAVQDIWTKMMQLGQEEGDVVARFVAQQTTGAGMDLGRGNVHWRIGQVEMARYLTCHLMDGAPRLFALVESDLPRRRT